MKHFNSTSCIRVSKYKICEKLPITIFSMRKVFTFNQIFMKVISDS